ncbi:uncharacterized protein DUF559 [Blastococcus colisei]|uniref:Uncharacterized protein DUF559 n=1 Tax=Blastococcus colisei TaxID=1564162 RepID=A0A543PB59_9ACTN|nr:DUF559 domain-containing protein [Blastococcus colisei]TQN41306.1 uncharacterized protein DUF559 [Blastococcus colisei]
MHDLAALLGPCRTASAATLSRAATDRTVRRWLASGRLVRLHPGWVTLPEWRDDWTVRAHAATGYTGGVLRHASALHAHGLVDEGLTRLDVTVQRDRVRSTRWLRIHRSARPTGIVIASGLAATSIARALVDTWGDAHEGRHSRGYTDLAQQAVFRAARERRLDPAGVESELGLVPRLPGLAALRELLGAVAAGQQSHLERLGLQALLAAGLPSPVLQHEIRLGAGTVHVDAAWPEVRLAVEFDGAAFHADREAWQRDLRRDAALAALGWVVLRFSYADITRRPTACGAQVAAAYRTRVHGVPVADVPGARMSGSGSPWPRSTDN